MRDRGMKKWRPFNSVVPMKTILGSDSAKVEMPILSKDEIDEYEELLKFSLYTHSEVEISYIKNGRIEAIRDYVLGFDAIKKDVILTSSKINFRQILRVKK